MVRAALILLCVMLAAGCGADSDYKQARHLDDTGQKMRALKAYERFLERHPEDPRAELVSFKTGEIYARVLGRCPEAVRHFEDVARLNGKFAEQARFGLMNCPDFFPLQSGTKWTFVDSATGGNIMRLEVGVLRSSAAREAEVAGWYYAGEQRDRDYWRGYSKADWTVWEQVEKDGRRSPVLKYPYRKGRSWSVTRGENTDDYTVVGDNLEVKVKAGSYSGCVKVKVHTRGYPSWLFQYFCPGVGRVKTTTGVRGEENPIEELAAFSSS